MSDFSGLATVYDVRCQDGRVIKQGAFDHQDGEVVPLVWRHNHSDMRNVIGHGVLKLSAAPPGVRIVGTFNKTKEGIRARRLVNNGDITNLSIYANEIIEHDAGDARLVNGGTIREVSLVLAGANPGAKIEDVIKHAEDEYGTGYVTREGIIVHSEEPITPIEEDAQEEDVVEEGDSPEVVEVDEEEVEDDDVPAGNAEKLAEMGLDVEKEVEHAGDTQTIAQILAGMSEDQQGLVEYILHEAVGAKLPSGSEATGKNVEEVYASMSPIQKSALNLIVGEITDPTLAQEYETIMNIFEKGPDGTEDAVITHEDLNNVLQAALKTKADSLRNLFDANDIQLAHSITNIDNLFPDAKNVDSGGPMFYARPMEWVEKVLGRTRRRPFSRIKSQYADLTPDAARAKGYVTGAQKVEEVIATLKRVTTPQTVYKLQKLDRDDILDITDFDVVVWLKSEMRMMLREELARAILIGDGRSGASPDKIVETNVRPIATDDAVYTIQWDYNDVGNLTAFADMTNAELVDLIDFIAEARTQYRGTGSPVMYASPEFLSKLLLVRDGDNRRIHPTKAALAEALRVSDIVEVTPMSGHAQTGVEDPTGLPAGTYSFEVPAIIVNLNDYVIGMDRGGQTSFFDDFDLDYNKYTYLYETRLSGALVVPKSAICVRIATAFAA